MANLAIELFLNTLVAFLVNFLGFGVLSLTRRGTRMSFVERLVTGALISNYTLMVVGTILGVVLRFFLREFFLFYLGLSLFVLIVYINSRLRKPIVIHVTKRSFTPLIIFICSVQVLFILAALMHPIHNSYDYVYFYGPMVKEIVKDNGIPIDIPYTQLRGDFAPGVLLTHVFSEMLFSTSAFRLVSYSHFLLALLVVYLLARTLFHDEELGLIAVVVMSLMPTVFIFFSTYSVYVEMSLMFYIIAGIWCIVMGLKTQENFWYILAGLSIALMLLSKNVGIYGIFIIFSIIPLFMRSKRFKILSVLLVLTPVLFRLFMNAFIYSKTSDFYLNVAFVEVVPTIAIAVIMYYASSKVTMKRPYPSKPILSMLLFANLAFIWYVRNFLILGTPTLNIIPNSSISQAELLYKEIFPVQEMYPNILNSLRVDYILTFTAIGAIFLVPKIFGFIEIIWTLRNHQGGSQERGKWMFVIFPLLSYMLLWLVIFYGTQESTAIRNGVIIIPFLSLVAAYGLVTLFRTVNLSAHGRCMLLTLLFSLYLIGTFETTLNRPSYLPSIIAPQPIISSNMILWSFFPLLVTIAIGIIYSKTLTYWTQLNPMKASLLRVGKFLFLFVPLIALLFNSPLMSMSNDLSKNDFDVAVYQESTLKVFSKWKEYDIALISYLASVNSSSSVVGYWVNGVYYFTGHVVLDPHEYPGIADIHDIVTARDATHMLQLLREKEISYIAIPLPNNPYYSQFVRFTYYFPFYNLAVGERYATYLGTFDMFELYKMKQSEKSFQGILDIRLVLSKDGYIASSPSLLKNHGGKNQSSYLVGSNGNANLNVVVDISGLRQDTNSRFVVETTAIVEYDGEEPALYFTRLLRISSTDDAMQIIRFGPLTPRASTSRFNIKQVLVEVKNEANGKTYRMEAYPIYSKTSFTYEHGKWTITQGSSFLATKYTYQ